METIKNVYPFSKPFEVLKNTCYLELRQRALRYHYKFRGCNGGNKGAGNRGLQISGKNPSFHFLR